MSSKGIGHQIRQAAAFLDVETTYALLLLTMGMAMAVDTTLEHFFAGKSLQETDPNPSRGRVGQSNAGT